MPTIPVEKLLKNIKQYYTNLTHESSPQYQAGHRLLNNRFLLWNHIHRAEQERLQQALGLTVPFHEGVNRQPYHVARGGFGSVTVLEDLHDQRLKVLKKLTSNKAIQESILEMVFHHKLKGVPYLLTFSDSLLYRHAHQGQLTHQFVLAHVMEYAQFGSLDKLVGLLPTVEPEVQDIVFCRIALSVLTFTFHAHRRRIVHLDHKPENWLADRKGNINVIDLGCCAELADDSFDMTIHTEVLLDGSKVTVGKGDNRYLAEDRQAAWENMGKVKFNARRADLFAIGVGLAELLTGEELADPYITEDAIKKVLNKVKGFEAHKALILDLIKEDPPEIEDLLNRRFLQRPEVHNPDLMQAATQFLKEFVEKQTNALARWEQDRQARYDFEKQQKKQRRNVYNMPIVESPAQPTISQEAIVLSQPVEAILMEEEKGQTLQQILNMVLQSELNNSERQQQRSELYIPLQGAYDREGATTFELEAHFTEWLMNDKKVMLLLAEGGSGKSTFCQRMAVQLAQQAQVAITTSVSSTNKILLPFYIALGQISDPQRLLETYLQGLNAKQIDYIKNYCQLLILLDGYDEMRQSINLYVANHWKDWHVKVLISCRPSVLSSGYQMQFLPYQENQQAQALFEEVYVQPFSDDRIQKYIHQYLNVQQAPLHQRVQAEQLDAKWLEPSSYEQVFQEIQGLAELAKNPFMLRLILEVLPRLSHQRAEKKEGYYRIEAIDVFQAFLEEWYSRQVAKHQHENASAQDNPRFEDVLALGQQLAEKMYEQGVVQANYHPHWVFNLEQGDYEEASSVWRPFLSDEAIQAKRLRPYLPLQRQGKYTHAFMHLQLQEYLVALKWYQELKSLGLPQPDEEEAWSKQASSLNLNQLYITQIPKARGIWNFLHQWVWQDETYQAILVKAIELSKDYPQVLGRLSSNSYSILSSANPRFNFTGRDLSGTQAEYAYLAGVNWDSVKGQGMNLKNTNMEQIWLRNADLTGADLTGADFKEYPYSIYSNRVNAIAASPEGRYQAVAIDKQIIIHDRETDTNQTLTGHTDQVCSVAWNEQGQLASGSWDGSVRIWNLSSGKARIVLKGHKDAVRCIAWNTQGLLASGSSDQTVRIWDPTTGKAQILTGFKEEITSIVWHDQNNQLAFANGNDVYVYDVSIEKTQILHGHTDWVLTLAWSKQGQLASGSNDQSIIIWDPKEGQIKKILTGHGSTVLCLAWNTQEELASGSSDSTIRIWDVETGKAKQTLTSNKNAVQCIAWNSHTQLISGSDDTVRIWNLNVAESSRQTKEYHTREVTGIAWSKQGQLASCSGDHTIRLWDIKTGRSIQILRGHTNSVNSISWNEQEQLASGSSDQTVYIWDIKTGKAIHILNEFAKPISSIAWGRQGQLAIGSNDDKIVYIYNTVTSEISLIKPHNQERKTKVSSLAWSAGNQLAWISNYNIVEVFNFDMNNGMSLDYSNLYSVNSIAWNNLEQLAAGCQGNQIKVNDFKHFKNTGISYAADIVTLSGHRDTVTSLASNAEGQLASGSSDQTVRIWEVNAVKMGAIGEAALKERAIISGYLGKITGLGWYEKNNQTYLAMGSANHSIKLWKQIHQTKDNDILQLVWSTHPSFQAEGCLLDRVIGLTSSNIKLLKQHGAVGFPLLNNLYPDWPAQHLAAASNDVQQLQALQEINKDNKDWLEETVNDKKTVLHVAAAYGALEATQWLLEQGVNPFSRTDLNQLPGELAYQNNFKALLYYLPYEDKNQPDNLPLHLAAQNGYFVAVQWLSKIHPEMINIKNRTGETPLWLAINNRHVDIAIWLVKQGVDVNITNKDGISPLNVAVTQKWLDLAQVLLDRGAFIDEEYDFLMTAIKNDQPEMALLLIERGVSVSRSYGMKGDTCLHHVVRKGWREVAEALIKAGVSVNAKNQYEETPLHVAAYTNKVEFLAFLKERGAELEPDSGSTALHSAAEGSAVAAIKWLLDQGLDVNLPHKSSGNTPLHIAAYWFSKKAVKTLLENGASVTIKNKQDKTPAELAIAGDLRTKEKREVLATYIKTYIHPSKLDAAKSLQDVPKPISAWEKAPAADTLATSPYNNWSASETTSIKVSDTVSSKQVEEDEVKRPSLNPQ